MPKKEGTEDGDSKGCPKACWGLPGAGSCRAVVRVRWCSAKVVEDWGGGGGEPMPCPTCSLTWPCPKCQFIPVDGVREAAGPSAIYFLNKIISYHLSGPSVCGFSTIFDLQKLGV